MMSKIADEFLGEYVPLQNERLAWVSGFTGSAGMVVVLETSAAIFVDGRYTIQVRQQVSADHYEFHHLIEEPPMLWLSKNLGAGARVGFDSRMHSYSWYEESRQLFTKQEIELVEISQNPIDKHWQDRPEASQSLALLLSEAFTGESSSGRSANGKCMVPATLS